METTETPTQPSVMSTGLKFGLILGIISVLFSIIMIVAGSNPTESNWVNMLLSSSITIGVIVFAHKSFKENGDGYMSYGQGLGIAVVATVVSIMMSGIFMYIYFQFIDPSAFEAIWEKAAADMEAKGNSDEQIEMGISIGRKIFWFAYVLAGGFGGLVIGLIVSIFTQKRSPELI